MKMKKSNLKTEKQETQIVNRTYYFIKAESIGYSLWKAEFDEKGLLVETKIDGPDLKSTAQSKLIKFNFKGL